MLNNIDYFIVIAYLIGLLFLGLYFRKFVHSSTDFFLGGRMLPFWAIGMSIVVSDIGALDFVGVAGQAYRHGIAVGNFDWIGSVPAMLLAAFVFVPCFWKSKLYTIPEYLGRRYNESVRMIASLTWIIFFAFNLGVIFWSSAVLLEELMGWNEWVSIIATAIVVGLYTFCGGLTAVVMTDVVQMIIMFVGGGAVVCLGFYKVGGWSGLVEKVSAMGSSYENHFNLILPVDTQTPFPWTGILFGLTCVMSMAYMIGNQAIVQRCFSAKNEWHAKASMIFGAFLKMMIPVLVLFPGLIAIVIHPQLEDGDDALPTLIRTLLPPGLRGLLFAAFLAGLMSSIDSVLNSTATLWTKDIYEKFIRKGAPDEHYLIVGRVATVAILVLGVITSPVSDLFPGIYVAIQTFLSIFQGPIFSVLLLGIFWKGTTQWGGLAGLVGGMVSSGLMYLFKGSLFTIEDPFLYVSWWSFVTGFIIAVVVSLFTQSHPVSRLYGLVYKLNQPQTEGIV
ncbi:MAG: sodium/solute symporter [Sedimentisphaerales bacterium]|nr:sodium/solute symporter [Sedimentisphaerales bacterium]